MFPERVKQFYKDSSKNIKKSFAKGVEKFPGNKEQIRASACALLISGLIIAHGTKIYNNPFTIFALSIALAMFAVAELKDEKNKLLKSINTNLSNIANKVSGFEEKMNNFNAELGDLKSTLAEVKVQVAHIAVSERDDFERV
jgi:hypothetical protein